MNQTSYTIAALVGERHSILTSLKAMFAAYDRFDLVGAGRVMAGLREISNQTELEITITPETRDGAACEQWTAAEAAKARRIGDSYRDVFPDATPPATPPAEGTEIK